jgi:threonine dehydrogenase-like Zn-dependent dehydrogenase
VTSIVKGGRLVVVAVYEEPAPIDLALVQDRELTLTGTLMYQKDDYRQAVALIERGQVVVEPLDSRHFPFEKYADAYRFIDEQGQSCMKVFIDL